MEGAAQGPGRGQLQKIALVTCESWRTRENKIERGMSVARRTGCSLLTGKTWHAAKCARSATVIDLTLIDPQHEEELAKMHGVSEVFELESFRVIADKLYPRQDLLQVFELNSGSRAVALAVVAVKVKHVPARSTQTGRQRGGGGERKTNYVYIGE